ncbi:MAG: MerR family transcriptional regulator [Bacteroidales bacterium]|jgi:DNA-binding transcriptional MerR regulator|nr:MerR family transcriptional regulator [Bacteroidales bacterium]
MNAGSRTYSIKDLENFCGIKAHTIRMWEKRYGILTPERSDSNIRHYTEEELKKLITVSILNRNGMKISKIAQLTDSELLREVLKSGAGDDAGDGSFKPGELIMSALRFSEEEFRENLSQFVREKGLTEAYLKVFHPLTQKARALWLTDCISKPQEQFIRHVIRTILISEDVTHEVVVNGQSAAIINLGSTESENNLVFLKYLLRKKGFNVVYTEGTLSADDIRGIHSVRPFAVLALNLPASEPDDEIRGFCSNMAKELDLKKVLVLGRYDTRGSWSNGKTKAVCSPAGLAEWADSL